MPEVRAPHCNLPDDWAMIGEQNEILREMTCIGFRGVKGGITRICTMATVRSRQTSITVMNGTRASIRLRVSGGLLAIRASHARTANGSIVEVVSEVD